MISFTSRFKTRVPKFTLLLIIMGVGAWGLAALYTLYCNPEIRDFAAGARIKRAYARALARSHTPKFIVFGGSSSSFSVDNEYATKELHAPMANMALGAGMGAQVITRFALLEALPGDTLVMTMEPALLAGRLDVTQLGQQFSIAIGEPQLAVSSLAASEAGPLSPGIYMSALRPGGFHAVTMLAKILSHTELYRYKIGEFKLGGQKTTTVHIQPVCPHAPSTLSPEGFQFIRNMKKWCEDHRVRLIYCLPWGYCKPGELTEFQNENLSFLRAISTVLPVLPDARLGAYSEEDQFADTAWHLTERGAKTRTLELVKSLQAGRLWSHDDLKEMKLGSPSPASNNVQK